MIYHKKKSNFTFAKFANTIKGAIFVSTKTKAMEVIFDKNYLQDLYTTGKADKKHRFQPQIVRKYIQIIDLMIEVDNVTALARYNSLNYEKLKGDKTGLSSVRVNDQYRIEFEEHMKQNEIVATICNITELSNHYK